jgi:hypothetical protein
VQNWVAYLDKKYGEQFIILGPPSNLDNQDARKLAKEAQSWRQSLSNFYSKDGTVLLTYESIGALFPERLQSNLDESTRADLNDGINSIFNLLPTPGAMILFRVAENILRKYYEKTTSKSATRMNWGQIVTDLEQMQRSKKELIGYLDFLRSKRNEAEHPDKRFTQEESERVLIQVKGLLEELSKQ